MDVLKNTRDIFNKLNNGYTLSSFGDNYYLVSENGDKELVSGQAVLALRNSGFFSRTSSDTYKVAKKQSGISPEARKFLGRIRAKNSEIVWNGSEWFIFEKGQVTAAKQEILTELEGNKLLRRIGNKYALTQNAQRTYEHKVVGENRLSSYDISTPLAVSFKGIINRRNGAEEYDLGVIVDTRKSVVQKAKDLMNEYCLESLEPVTGYHLIVTDVTAV